MSTQAIQALLDARLKTQIDAIGAATRPAVQWAGMTLAAGNLPYLRPTIIPAQARQVELGATGANRESGIYQVDCYYPSGVGRGTGQTMAEAIASNFKRGTDIAGSGFTVKLTSATVGRMREEPDRISFPVTILWRADTPNP